MALKRHHVAISLAGSGALVAAAGVAMVYLPAALIVLGGSLCAFGLLAIDVGGRKR